MIYYFSVSDTEQSIQTLKKKTVKQCDSHQSAGSKANHCVVYLAQTARFEKNKTEKKKKTAGSEANLSYSRWNWSQLFLKYFCLLSSN